mmetsp:Transcript_897/g.1558  ORF Transcript_897/g.1558 Transcript_897/m.1558 type:complete len:478 (+) Transcript_897:139-1572(+)
MPRVKKKSVPEKGAISRVHVAASADSPTLVVDNGAGRIKYGWSTEEQPVGTMPNALAKIHKTLESVVGDEIDSVPEATSQLRFSRPFDRGHLVNWNVQRDIWHRMLVTNMNVNPADCHLVLTVPPFCPEEIQQDINEVLFEELEFSSALCRPAAWFSSYNYSQGGGGEDATDLYKECNIVVDSGFSFSHAIPFVNGVVRGRAAKRVNVGGKLLTNYLKEIISYRQWNFMDEFLLVNQVKDTLCYVSQDFSADLSRCMHESPNMRVARPSHNDGHRSEQGGAGGRHEQEAMEEEVEDEVVVDVEGEECDDGDEYLRKFFVLPDFHHVMKGFVKEDGEGFQDHEQVLTMESERFSIPEILFHPTDIGIAQAGVVEALGEAIHCLHKVEGELCSRNIILTGGNANLPGYRQRFQQDITQYIPDHWDVNIFQPEDPTLYAWQGAALFARQEQAAGRYHNYVVSRAEYLEHGHSVCSQKFCN